MISKTVLGEGTKRDVNTCTNTTRKERFIFWVSGDGLHVPHRGERGELQDGPVHHEDQDQGTLRFKLFFFLFQVRF